MRLVPAWKAIEQAEPAFAGRVRRLFDAGRVSALFGEGLQTPNGVELDLGRAIGRDR